MTTQHCFACRNVLATSKALLLAIIELCTCLAMGHSQAFAQTCEANATISATSNDTVVGVIDTTCPHKEGCVVIIPVLITYVIQHPSGVVAPAAYQKHFVDVRVRKEGQTHFTEGKPANDLCLNFEMIGGKCSLGSVEVDKDRPIKCWKWS